MKLILPFFLGPACALLPWQQPAIGQESPCAPAAAESFRTDGWTSRSLEAVVDYETTRSMRGQPELEAGLSDFDLLSRTFLTARRRLLAQGQDLHQVYEARRREMPGSSAQR